MPNNWIELSSRHLNVPGMGNYLKASLLLNSFPFQAQPTLYKTEKDNLQARSIQVVKQNRFNELF